MNAAKAARAVRVVVNASAGAAGEPIENPDWLVAVRHGSHGSDSERGMQRGKQALRDCINDYSSIVCALLASEALEAQRLELRGLV